MLFKKKKPVKSSVNPPDVQKPENPRISLEFLPDGKVMSTIYWEPHSNVNINLIANVINLLNQGKLFETFKVAALNQGRISGDQELGVVLAGKIKDPNSTEDEVPLIPSNMVTRYHFTQQKIDTTED